MISDALKENLGHIKEITREIYVFTNQLNMINNIEINSHVSINRDEKKLLVSAVASLTNQVKILNNSIPALVQGIGFYRKLGEEKNVEGKGINLAKDESNLVQVNYKPLESEEKVSITINNKDRDEFLKNLSKSNLSINLLKKKYSIERPLPQFGKPNEYAKMSNKFFRNTSINLISKGYFKRLNATLRKMNSPFVISTYVSMILFSVLLSFIAGIFIVIFLLFFNISISIPFFSFVNENILIRFIKVFWIAFVLPLLTGFLFYFYPNSEGKSLGSKINQELPFAAIHMSAIATSGIEPSSIFKIILRSEEYPYTNIEFRKIMNLVNFQGKDIVSALKIVARTSPSSKLKELLEGMATTITSGGSLHDFLDKHSDSLLFDYKLEREKYAKISETLMDIYISIVIAAPMILLMLFVIIGSTGSMSSILGLSTDALGILIILIIILLNIGFLIFLRFAQPNL